ncbi:hypothetical protein QZH41_011130, partial [Actinostola sp. cb2023]
MSRDRKRYYDDDEDEKPRKRRRMDEAVDIEDRLESLITRVGEKSTSSLESNLEGLSNVLEADLPNYKDRILKIICTCVTNLPEKIAIYSTLVGLLNAKNYKFGEEFLDMIMANLKDVLASNQFERARLMVRFLADLVNCHVVLPISLIELFEKFVGASMESDVTQVRTDTFVYSVLSALPWAGKELSEKKGHDLERLLSAIDGYISQRQKLHIPALRVWSTDDVHPQEEYLDCLWAQIKKLKTDDWQEKHIRRPYLAFDSVLGEALQHSLPSFTVPSHQDDAGYPCPTVIYRMFDYTDVPEGPALPGAHSIERFLVEESIRRVMNAHYKDRKECVTQFQNLPGQSKVPFNYCIVEVIFSEMFRLPNPPHIDLFYGSLLIELCKSQPNAMPGIVAQATELLFEHIETMNTTCIDRFCNWLSHHLSNFNFKWSWVDWAQHAADPASSKYKFISELIEKLIRFSYNQYLVERLPEEFQPLIPPPSQPKYRFSEDGLPGGDIAKQLLEAIKAKKDFDELQALLNEISPSANEQADDGDAPAAEPSFSALRIEVLFHTVLRLGCKSISHSFSALAKASQSVIRRTDTHQSVKTLKEFWETHPQLIAVIIDKLVRMQIIECPAVVNWLLSNDMSADFTRCYSWEIMKGTLSKMSKHTIKVHNEVDEVKDQLVKMEERAQRQQSINTEGGEDKSRDHVLVEEIERKKLNVEQLTEKLENAQRGQKQLYLILFQRFIMMLTEHLVRCEQHQHEVTTPWFKYTTERLREVLLM